MMSTRLIVMVVLSLTACLQTGEGDELLGDDQSSGESETAGGETDGGMLSPCSPSASWIIEDLGTPTRHLIALSEDDRLHLWQGGTQGSYRSRPLGSDWSEVETVEASVGTSMDEMVARAGELTVTGKTMMVRDELGWSEEEWPGVSGAHSAALLYSPDAVLHTVSQEETSLEGGEGYDVVYRRRAPAAEWETVATYYVSWQTLYPEIAVVDEGVLLCHSTESCWADLGSGPEPIDSIGSFEMFSLSGRWAAVSSQDTVEAFRWDGVTWESVGGPREATVSAIEAAEDRVGGLHVVTLEEVEEEGETIGVGRYWHISADGAVSSEVVACDIVAAHVVGLADGSPIVSYRRAYAVPAGTFLATRPQ